MTTHEAIDEYIVPEELKNILKNQENISDIDGICSLFYYIHDVETCIEEHIWLRIYDALWSELLHKFNKTGIFIHIKEYKPIKEWLLEGGGEKYLQFIYDLIDKIGPIYKEGRDFENIKTISVMSALFIIDSLIWNKLNLRVPECDEVFYFYKTHNRFMNDFDS